MLSNSQSATENCTGSVSISGDPEFSIVNGKDFDITPGESHELVVRFDCRHDAGNPNATITISSNDPDGDIEVDVTGNCVELDVPDIAASTEQVRFARVQVGSSRERRFILFNRGTADVVVTETQLLGSNRDLYEVTNAEVPFTIEPGENRELRVTFTPDSAGNKVARIQFFSNDPDENPLVVKLRGEGVGEPDIAVDPAKLDFGEVQVGKERDLKVTVSNEGTVNLEVSDLQLTGADADQWEIVDGETPFTIAPAESEDIKLSFTLTSAGQKTATLQIRSNDPDEDPIEIPLTGIGVEDSGEPDIAASPDSPDFGEVEIGQRSEQAVTVSNEGTADLQVSDTGLSGTDADQWEITNGEEPFTLAPSETQEVILSFGPTSAGVKSATLEIASNDPDEDPLIVELTGTGVEPATVSPFAGIIVINEIHYNPSTAQGSDNDFEFLELFNTSEDSINLDGFSFSDGLQHTFTSEDTLPANGFLVLAKNAESYPGSIQWESGQLVSDGEALQIVDPDGALVDSVEYDHSVPWPTEADGDGPSLELIDALSDNSLPENWQASFVDGGTPGAENSSETNTQFPNIVVNPNSANYGEVTVGASSSQAFEISNDGSADLEVAEYTIEGTAAGHFSIADDAPFSLVPGESHSIEVLFAPAAEGEMNATLRIVSNDPDEAVLELPLTGQAVQAASPNVAIDITEYDFGVLNLGVTENLVVTVSNTGGADVEITTTKLVGEDAGQFSLESGEVPFTLASGENRELIVATNPTATGERSTILRLETNDPDEHTVDISISMYVNTPPSTPVLLQPEGGEEADVLVWQHAVDPDPNDETSYTLEISPDEQFSEDLFVRPGLRDTSMTVNEIAASYDFTSGSFYYWRVKAVDSYDADSDYSEAAYFQYVTNPTAVEDSPATEVPVGFSLAQNYPNPFNPETQIRYELPASTSVTLKIYDVRGQEVRTLMDRELKSAGVFTIPWDGRDNSGNLAPSGTYFYRMVLSSHEGKRQTVIQTKKMSFVK